MKMINKIFLFTTLQIIVAGSLFAQGPVQPEAMQFESVDVTDVVNLATGDFVYTIPIMNVPGPSGDFPIVLSYHSGIGPNQPATWVGLGWTLNPGAVNRTLSGYPDDYKGDIVITDYQANSKSSWGLSLGAGWGPVGVNMTYDHESGKVGVNAMISVFSALGVGGPFDVNVAGGSGGFSANASLGKGSRLKGTNLIASGSVSAGTGGIGISGGLSRGGRGYEKDDAFNYKDNYSLISVGASLTSQGGGGSFSVAGTGFSSVTSSSGGKVSSKGFSIRTPKIGNFWVSLGYSRWKWTLDETFTESSYGLLYQQDNFDVFNSTNTNIKNERYATEEVLFPSKDAYNVAAQGVSGSFSPVFDYPFNLIDKVSHNEKGFLDRNQYQRPFYNRDTDMYQTNYQNPNFKFSTNDAKFRFLDDTGYNFANKGTYTFKGEYTYSPINNVDYGGKKITPILNDISGKIEGFIITTPDGMVYEFGQPVFNVFQYSRTEVGTTINKNVLRGPYATSWLLTAIKGPDYVDRGQNQGAANGNLDDYDWGYWVKLNYDLMDEVNIWRAPYSGMSVSFSEDDEKIEQFSTGIRHVYHLSSIETKTHIAVFEAAESQNGKNANIDFSDVSYLEYIPDQTVPIDISANPNNVKFTFKGDYRWIYDVATDTDIIFSGYVGGEYFECTKNQLSFGFSPGQNETIITPHANVLPANLINSGTGTIRISNIADRYAISHKKLDAVRLYNKSFPIQAGNEISKTAFDYSYSLRGKSSGSTAMGTGALTLDGVFFYGQNNVLVSPPYRFQYAYGHSKGMAYNPDYNKDDYDFWGSYRFNNGMSSEQTQHLPHQDKGMADLAAAWSLTGITTPTGSRVGIEYESDDFFHVNNTFYLADGLAFTIDKSTSSGSILKIGENITSTIFDDIESVFLVQKNTVSITGYNTVFVETSVLGRFDITNIDAINDKITLQDSPVLLQDELLAPGITRNYLYQIVALPNRIYGGGSRVKMISTTDGYNQTRTQYTYSDGAVSSGVTASLPADYSDIRTDPRIDDLLEVAEDYQAVFMDHKYAYGRPNPGVIYSKVQVLNVNENLVPVSGMTEYEFFTAKDVAYKPDVGDIHYYIDDRSGIYGKPKATTYFEQYDDGGNIQFRSLKRTENLYAYSDSLFDQATIYFEDDSKHTNTNQPLGVTQQTHASYIAIDGGGSGNDHDKVVERTYFNVFGTGQKVTEYFYDDPLSSTYSSQLTATGKTIGIDVNTGVSIITAQQAAGNNEVIITKTTPAWWNSSYSGMKDKNMLTQTFQETVYRSEVSIDDPNLKNQPDGNANVLSSTINTWSNLWVYKDENSNAITFSDIWRKNDTYSYVPIAGYSYNDFPATDPGLINGVYPPVTSSFPWKKTSDIVQYDNFGHAIETVNEDGTYQAVLYDEDNRSLVKAVASNAKLDEIIFIDYENSGNSTSEAHTGLKSTTSLGVATPSIPPIHNTASIPMKYKFGVWVKGVGAEINFSPVLGANNNTWVYFEKKASENEFITGSGGYFDDVTIIPEYASISYFTYDPTTWKVTAMTGPDHRTSFYEYDGAGRLVGVRDQDRNLVQNNEYNYGTGYTISTTGAQYGVNDPVTFELESFDPNVTAASDFEWDFGDGFGYKTNSTSANHTYANGGEYSVSVTFIDSKGHTRRSSYTINIGDLLDVGITITRTNVLAEFNSQTLAFVDAIAQPEGGIQPYQYKWYYKEGGVLSSNPWVLLSDEKGSMVKIKQSFTNANTATLFSIKVEVEDFLDVVKSVTHEVINTNLNN